MKKSAVLLFTFCLAVSNSYALEGGASSYPLGILTVMSGAVGAPGETGIYTYNKRIQLESLRDGQGDKQFPKAKGTIHAHALRVVHTLEETELLGGNVSVQAALPYVKGDIDIPALGAYGYDDAAGMGDPLFGVLVSWVSPRYFQNVEFDLVEPWGKYRKGALINPGNNARALYAAYAFSWFALPQVEVSSKISLNYSFENDATNYQSGIQLVADYGVNYRISDAWLAGVGGYITTQLNDDEQFGKDVGNRTKNIKVGPQIGYAQTGWGVVAAYQKDVFARNVGESNVLMINTVVRF
ncbi:transporter [Pseudomonas sp. Irchel s3f7]|uniref:SphA family protein n=1 Tax=Pseudomonas sp. Irchel s3f7 TaxID=2009153 RepID=UPI000BA4DA20|nr:transporter [Pseudomonas sp. Irchel s3f7]